MEAIYEINLKIAPLQLNKSQYLSRIEGSPPKRNVAGSTPVWDATNSAESLILQGFQRFLIVCLYNKTTCYAGGSPYGFSPR